MKKRTSGLSGLSRRTLPPPISWLMQLPLTRPKLVSLAAGFTDSETLPVKDVRDLIAEFLHSSRTGRAALQYGSTQGDPVLRRLTAQRVRAEDGARPGAAYDPGRMIITNGSQQLLYMASEALCDPGDIVILEDPTYFVYLGICQSHGLQARAVRTEQDGLDLGHLDELLSSLKKSGELRRAKLLYLVTYFQNPTGVTTSFRKKAGALELLKRYESAAGHPIYLLEDAAYRELRFGEEDVPSALSLSRHEGRLIYTGTYSKPFATGVRVGFGLFPEPVFSAVLRIKGNHDFGTSNLMQQLVTRAIGSGRYDRHVALLRRAYARKAGLMRDAILTRFPPAVEWTEAKGGLYYWARVPQRLKTGQSSNLFKAALRNNVLYVPGELCYADDRTRRKPNHEMRLSYGSATAREIPIGIEKLGSAIARFL